MKCLSLMGTAVLLSLLVPNGNVTARNRSVSLTVTSSSGEPVRFKGAVMFQEGGFQSIEGTTPLELRGGGVAVGMFERVGEGPELRVRVSAGDGEAIGTAGRVIVGSELINGITHFARVF